jgi:calcineurin-like phosphoesterase
VIVVNVDNISSGRGPIEKHLRELEKAGVDIMTA